MLDVFTESFNCITLSIARVIKAIVLEREWAGLLIILGISIAIGIVAVAIKVIKQVVWGY